MQEELRDIIREAKAKGLVPVVWSYPRGGKISKEGETALDIVAYAAHMAALMGATIIKVKPPKAGDRPRRRQGRLREGRGADGHPAGAHRARDAGAFAGRRLVVFSGGEAKGTEGVLDEIRADPRRRRPRLDHRPQQLPAARRRRRWSCWTRWSRSTSARREPEARPARRGRARRRRPVARPRRAGAQAPAVRAGRPMLEPCWRPAAWRRWSLPTAEADDGWRHGLPAASAGARCCAATSPRHGGRGRRRAPRRAAAGGGRPRAARARPR